jgi:hypothetical protein
MPLNPSIALGVRPLEIPNQLAQYSQLAQIQNAQNQNALAQYQLGSAQRAEKLQNLTSDAYSQSIDPATGQVNYNTLIGKLAAGGGGSQIPGIEKTRKEIETAALTQDKLRTELVTAKTAQFRDRLNNVNSPDAAARWTEAMYRDPHLSGTVSSVPLEAALAEIPLTPQEFNVWKKQNALGMAEFIKQNKPTTQVIDQSGQRQVVQIPGLGGAPTTVGTYVDVPLPANVQAQKIQIAQQSRPPLQPVAPTITQIVDPSDPNKMITIDARRYQGGGAGSPGVIGVSGKEPSAALRENKTEAGKTQLADDLENLRFSFQKLDSLRAIPSTERNALSNVTSGLASTAIGQRTGQLFATEAQVERDVINSARSRLVNSIKNATGMSAQQLNSNVELQTMLKSISDPGQSYQSAIRIIEDIEDAYVKGKGMKNRGAPAPAPAATQGTGGFKYLGKESTK